MGRVLQIIFAITLKPDMILRENFQQWKNLVKRGIMTLAYLNTKNINVPVRSV